MFKSSYLYDFKFMFDAQYESTHSFNFGSPKNKWTNLKENDHDEEKIRKLSGFVIPIKIL